MLSSAVGYLLMLAVMQYSVWFFIAIIIGLGAGEMGFGRYCRIPRERESMFKRGRAIQAIGSESITAEDGGGGGGGGDLLRYTNSDEIGEVKL